MKKIYILFILLSIALFSNSCESLDLDGQTNANLITDEEVNPDFLLSSVQVSFATFFYGVSNNTRQLTRMINQAGTYAVVADPQNNQAQWTNGYSEVLKDASTIYKIGKTKSIPHHEAIARILEAYAMTSLVDYYGDVPYSQAILGAGNLNPAVDSGSAIYDAMFVKLDEAIVLLGKSNLVPLTDFYYGGTGVASTNGTNVAKWIKLANTLKLKMLNNLRLTRDVSTQVNQIVTSGNIMTSNADDFNFKYSTDNTPRDFRHPDFIANYFANKGAYMSNSYLNLMFKDKVANGGVDPRVRHYFYRQTSTAPSGGLLPCTGNVNIPICYIGVPGYWGRDHGDNTAQPNDQNSRTIVGLYPAGGKFDSNTPSAVSSSIDKGAKGAGILNILDYSFLQFMLAELSLTEAGVNGSPALYLRTAVNENMNKVRAFKSEQFLTSSSFAPQSAVDAYKNEVDSKYLAASSTTDKLNVIMKEYFIALWGNGFEAYNMYRRTGMPLQNSSNIGMEAPVIAIGSFTRSFFYPKNAIDNNSSIVQHPIEKRVFWDNNPETGFIN